MGKDRNEDSRGFTFVVIVIIVLSVFFFLATRMPSGRAVASNQIISHPLTTEGTYDPFDVGEQIPEPGSAAQQGGCPSLSIYRKCGPITSDDCGFACLTCYLSIMQSLQQDCWRECVRANCFLERMEIAGCTYHQERDAPADARLCTASGVGVTCICGRPTELE